LGICLGLACLVIVSLLAILPPTVAALMGNGINRGAYYQVQIIGIVAAAASAAMILIWIRGNVFGRDGAMAEHLHEVRRVRTEWEHSTTAPESNLLRASSTGDSAYLRIPHGDVESDSDRLLRIADSVQ